MCFMFGLYSEFIQIIQMVFRYMFGFYSWNFRFRKLYMEFICIECGLHRIYLWFVQLFRQTFFLEGTP